MIISKKKKKVQEKQNIDTLKLSAPKFKYKSFEFHKLLFSVTGV